MFLYRTTEELIWRHPEMLKSKLLLKKGLPSVGLVSWGPCPAEL